MGTLRAPAADRMNPSEPFYATAGGVRLRFLVTPGAARSRIEGVRADVGGGCVVKVAVAAEPERGKANAALIRLLAEEWDVPRSSLTVVTGAADRRKTIVIGGDTAKLTTMLSAWTAARRSIDGDRS